MLFPILTPPLSDFQIHPRSNRLRNQTLDCGQQGPTHTYLLPRQAFDNRAQVWQAKPPENSSINLQFLTSTHYRPAHEPTVTLQCPSRDNNEPENLCQASQIHHILVIIENQVWRSPSKMALQPAPRLPTPSPCYDTQSSHPASLLRKRACPTTASTSGLLFSTYLPFPQTHTSLSSAEGSPPHTRRLATTSSARSRPTLFSSAA